jgi:thioredoxin 1
MTGKNLKEIKDMKEFDGFIKDSTVVVDFYADWCGPCKVLGPIIEETAGEYDGTVKFVKVNVDSNQELAQRFQVMSIPTVLFFKNGEQVERFSGALSKDELKTKVDESF